MGLPEAKADKLAVSILGLDETGICHLEAAVASGMEVIGIADPTEARREAAVNRLLALGQTRPWTGDDGLSLFKKLRPDAVVLSTSVFSSWQTLDAALGSKCHVMLQGPPIMSADDWDGLTGRFRSAHRILQLAAPWRLEAACQNWMRQACPSATRAALTCAVPAEARDPRSEIIGAMFPLFDVLAGTANQAMPALVFSVGKTFHQNRMSAFPNKILAGAIRTHGGMDISFEYKIDRTGHGNAGSLALYSSRLDRPASEWRLTHSSANLTSLWSIFVAALRGDTTRQMATESFRVAMALTNSVWQAQTAGQTLHYDNRGSTQ